MNHCRRRPVRRLTRENFYIKFFQRGEYERNPVASVNNSVAELFAATNAKMESEARLLGAKYVLLQAG